MKAVISLFFKRIIFCLVVVALVACVTVDVQPQVTAQPEFVTATLAPTQAGLTRATLTPNSITVTDTAPTSVSTNTAPANCKDGAVLLRDVTIPDNTQVQASETLIKTWEFQNTGTCAWTNYTVKFSNGDEMHAPLSAPVPDTPPNERTQVSLELTAPSADGRYTGYFTLNNANGEIIPIGTEKTFWVKFMVGTYASLPTSSAPSGSCIQGPNADYVNQVVALINVARNNAGLAGLTFNGDLAAFAQHHAEDMAYKNFLSHDGSDGSFGERMMNFSLSHTGQQITGEILAIGTPQNAIDQWRKDEHWDYVLGAFTQIGAGYAYNSCSDYGGYFTVDLSN